MTLVIKTRLGQISDAKKVKVERLDWAKTPRTIPNRQFEVGEVLIGTRNAFKVCVYSDTLADRYGFINLQDALDIQLSETDKEALGTRIRSIMNSVASGLDPERATSSNDTIYFMNSKGEDYKDGVEKAGANVINADGKPSKSRQCLYFPDTSKLHSGFKDEHMSAIEYGRLFALDLENLRNVQIEDKPSEVSESETRTTILGVIYPGLPGADLKKLKKIANLLKVGNA